MADPWRLPPGHDSGLSSFDPGSTPGAPGEKTITEAAVLALQKRLQPLQEKLWAESKRSLLIILQGLDAAGKDGTIKHVFTGVNPQGVRVAAFKEPTAEELAHDFLWRVHRAVPRAGELGIFNRSHYEDVLVARVDHLVAPPVWKARFANINAFESLLHDAGTTIIKFYLHISRQEQARRLEDRLQQPDKRWKLSPSDLVERAHWDAYMKAYADVFKKTSTKIAPWHVIPADHKWYRNWAVSKILVETLEDMDPRYPDPPPMDDIAIS